MIVIKMGGSAGVNADSVCRDVAELVRGGQPVVLVHGGSAETNAISERLGHPARFVTSASGVVSRFTDRETLQIYAMVTGGRINKLLVERLQQLGVNAVGVSGIDGRLLEAKRKEALRVVENGKVKVLRGDYSGQIERVNAGLLHALLSAGFVPVVAPLAISEASEALNVDGDRAAAAIAVALQAETLVILSNVPGLLRNVQDEDTIIRRIPLDRAPEHMERYAQGRMKKKLLGAIEALQQGIGRAVIADGRVERPVQRALAGEGTVIE